METVVHCARRGEQEIHRLVGTPSQLKSYLLRQGVLFGGWVIIWLLYSVVHADILIVSMMAIAVIVFAAWLLIRILAAPNSAGE